MCNANPQQMAWMEQTVRQFLDEGRAFTAYDVTIETREREAVEMRHRDVQGACHEIQILLDAMDFGHTGPDGNDVQWQRSRYDLPGGRWAFLYHPVGFDPATYVPRTTGQTTPTQATQPTPAAPRPTPQASAPVGNGNQSDSGGKNDDGSYSQDYRGRLLIPTSYLRDAGLTSGDVCHVICDPENHLVLLAGDSTNFQGQQVKITTQRVERDGDLRLSSKTLGTADLDTDKFVIETTKQAQTALVKVAAKG